MAPPMKKPVTNPGLAEALARPENKVCADCGARGASWASVNLGIFVCMECSAVHRKIGVHISVVKSSTLDTWQSKWIDTCTRVGNRIANDYYEHRLPPNFPRPGEPGGTSLSMEEWIRSKYERRDYAPTNRGRKCETPSELVQEGRDPDVYSRHDEHNPEDVPRACTGGGDHSNSPSPSSSGSGSSRRSELEERQSACPAADSTWWATFASEDNTTFELLTKYYARVGQEKSPDQLNLIIDRFRGKEDTLFAQLEKKYGQPVRMVPATSSSPPPATGSPSFERDMHQPSTPCEPAVVASGLLIPDVFKVQAEAVQRQQDSQDQQFNCLQHNLSALYQQSAQTQTQPVVAASGANYNDLMCMQPSAEAQQIAWMQQMTAMQQMQQMQHLAAMQHMVNMPQMPGAAQISGMQQGFGAQ